MRRGRSDRPEEGRARLENVAVVLHRPKLPENIGAAARAACDMGLSRFIVVGPVDLDPKGGVVGGVAGGVMPAAPAMAMRQDAAVAKEVMSKSEVSQENAHGKEVRRR